VPFGLTGPVRPQSRNSHFATIRSSGSSTPSTAKKGEELHPVRRNAAVVFLNHPPSPQAKIPVPIEGADAATGNTS
jgi:hypothetical protein